MLIIKMLRKKWTICLDQEWYNKIEPLMCHWIQLVNKITHTLLFKVKNKCLFSINRQLNISCQLITITTEISRTNMSNLGLNHKLSWIKLENLNLMHFKLKSKEIENSFYCAWNSWINWKISIQSLLSWLRNRCLICLTMWILLISTLICMANTRTKQFRLRLILSETSRVDSIKV
jgi:hypothetical protein